MQDNNDEISNPSSVPEDLTVSLELYMEMWPFSESEVMCDGSIIVSPARVAKATAQIIAERAAAEVMCDRRRSAIASPVQTATAEVRNVIEKPIHENQDYEKNVNVYSPV